MSVRIKIERGEEDITVEIARMRDGWEVSSTSNHQPVDLTDSEVMYIEELLQEEAEDDFDEAKEDTRRDEV